MYTRTQAILIAVAAAAMMLALVANASARNLRVSEKNFEILWGGARHSPSKRPETT